MSILRKDILEHKLTELLEAFKTDELSLDTINDEVETVRGEHYETSDEEAIEGIREGLKQAFSNQTIPLSQMWEGIDAE